MPLTSWATKVYHTGGEKTLILLWVDDNPHWNKKLSDMAKEQDINVYEVKTTDEAIEFLTKYGGVLKSSKSTELRIITDMHRFENGVEKKTAGLELIEKIDKIESLKNIVRFVKIYSSSETEEEAMVYIFFYPEHLTIDKRLFQKNGKQLVPGKSIYYVDYDMSLTNPLTTIQLGEDAYSRLFNQRYVKFLLDTLSDDLNSKLKTSNKVTYKMKNIRHVFNPELLRGHRQLYFQYAKNLSNSGLVTKSTSTATVSVPTDTQSMTGEVHNTSVNMIKQVMPQSLLVYHGTNPNNIDRILQTGLAKKGVLDSGFFGGGFYVTTYPHYAAHYIKYQGIDKDHGFKAPIDVGQEAKIIAGFCLPGKTIKIEKLAMGKPLEPGYDSHVVRVDFKGNTDFMPVTKKEEQTADELIVFKTEQFLPCFVITLKRTS